jgi:hypothetical protein
MEIEVAYRREVFYNDLVISRAKQLKEARTPTFLHQILSGKSEVEIARMRTRWGKG